MLHLCFPSAAPLWKHYSCSRISSACHSRSICFKKGDHTNWLALPCSGLCLFPPHFPPKAVLVWRINSTPLTIPPYSGVAHAITLSHASPSLVLPFSSAAHAGSFLWKEPLHPPTHSSRFSLCISSSKRPSSVLGATLCSSVNLYHCSVPFILTLHHLLLCILN